MKKGLAFLFAVVALMTLCSCSFTREKSEDEIKEDLQKVETIFPSGGQGTITNVEITKRQTNIDDKMDIVYAIIEGENEKIEMRVGYKLTYILYNEGWLLEGLEADSDSAWEIIPITGVPVESALSMMDGVYENVEFTENDPFVENENGVYRCTYNYKGTINHLYMNQVDTGYTSFSFSNNSGLWVYDGYTVTDTEEQWNINGIWSGKDETLVYGTFNFYVEIENYDGKEMEGTIQITVSDNHVFKQDNSLYSGTGVFDIAPSEWFSKSKNGYTCSIKIEPDGVYGRGFDLIGGGSELLEKVE